MYRVHTYTSASVQSTHLYLGKCGSTSDITHQKGIMGLCWENSSGTYRLDRSVCFSNYLFCDFTEGLYWWEPVYPFSLLIIYLRSPNKMKTGDSLLSLSSGAPLSFWATLWGVLAWQDCSHLNHHQLLKPQHAVHSVTESCTASVQGLHTYSKSKLFRLKTISTIPKKLYLEFSFSYL